MIPGETILGLDAGQHLWVVLTSPDSDGNVVITNLTTHGQSPACGSHCVVIKPEEHAWLKHDSCIYYRRADFNPVQPLDTAKSKGTLNQADPMSDAVLTRIREGALQSRFVAPRLKSAISDELTSSLSPGPPEPPSER